MFFQYLNMGYGLMESGKFYDFAKVILKLAYQESTYSTFFQE